MNITLRKQLLFILMLPLLLAFSVSAIAQSIVIGTGTSNTDGNAPDPIDGYYESMHYQTVYTASELMAAGLTGGSTITALGFSVSQAYAGAPLQNYTVKMGHTAQADASAYISSSMTTVVAPFSYTPTVQTAGNFDMITFTNNFVWDGVSNIVVDLCSGDTNPYTSPYGGVLVHSMTNGASYARCDGCTGGICASATGVITGSVDNAGYTTNRPNIQFNYTPGAACSGQPNVATATAPTNVCAGSAFTLAATGMSVGTGLSYDWQYFDGSNWVSTGGTSPSFIVTAGITAQTDYRFVTTCVNGGLQDISNSVTVGINPFYNCYCTPVSNCTNEGIVNVTFDVLNYTSTFCNATSGYTDYSGLGATAVLTQAQVVPITVSARINDVSNNYAGVWIDYDHSGTFDASEYTSLGASGALASPPDTFAFTANINVPANALTGTTRMRVRSSNGGGITAASACNTGTVYGEYEDYLINIGLGNGCTGAPTAGTVSGPSNICAGGSFVLTASGFTSGVTGLAYEWQVYNAGTSSWGPAPGTNNGTTYTASTGVLVPTDYRFSIQCTNGGQQDFTAAYTVTPSVVTSFPFVEDFESASVTLPCWKVVDSNADGDMWTFTSSTTYAHSGSYKAQLYTDGNSGNNNDWLISPAITLTGNQILKYWYRVRSSSEPNDYTIKLSTTGSDPADFTTVLKPLTSASNTTYQKDSIDLSAYTGTVFIAFHVPSGGLDGWYLYVDDVSVEDIPPACAGQPNAATVTGPTAVCANADFTLTAAGYSIGPGISYEWQVYNTATNVWDPATGTNNTGSYTVTGGITTPTDYRFTTTCANGGSQDITAGYTVSISPFYNCYCTPASTCTNEGIINVTFDALNNSSTYCNATSGYTDYASLGALATVTQGQAVPMSVSAHINSNPASAGVWIDYDQNGSFDASEYTSLGSSSNISPLPDTFIFAGNVNISVGALTGTTRMRVRTANQGGITAASACNTSTVYGEYEDYLITINVGNNCSGQPVAGTTIASVSSVACSGSPFILSANGFTNGVTGLSFQWQESTDGVSFINIGAPTLNYSDDTISGISQDMYYRLEVTCTNGGAVDYSNTVTVNFALPTVPWTEGFETVSSPDEGVFPSCWTSELISGTNVGTTTTTDSHRDPNTGTTYLYTGYNSTAWVYTPGFNLNAGTSYDFSFYMKNETVTSPVDFVMDVAYGSAQTSASMTNSLQAGYVPTNSGYQQFKYSFTPSTTGVYYFGIKSTSTSYTPWYLSFDDFALDLTPACPAPNGLTANSISTDTANLTWTPVASSSNYEYVIDQTATDPGGAGTQANDTFYNATGLTANSTYYFHLRSACSGGAFSPWVTINFHTQHVNDMCSGAIPVPWTGTITGDNTDAAPDALPAVSCGSTTAGADNGLWYTVTPIASGTLTIATCGTPFDTYIRVYEGSCGSFTACAGYDDDACVAPTSSASTVDIAAVANTTYYVLVSGYDSGDFGAFTLTATGVPLAIKMERITAANAGSRNRIDWKTGSELKSDWFELERSKNGSSFTRIATINAKGVASTYTYWDEQPEEGINYYRLKLTEASGNASYSNVVHATVKGGGFSIDAYPNPVTNGRLTVVAYGTEEKSATVMITDLSGKVIKVINMKDGLAEIDMNGLAQGMYLVKYTDNSHARTIKVNKQ